jgi:SAM-dependent methyltransferase
MLKDYCIPKNESGSEEEFVGEFWDERWAEAVDDLAVRRQKMLRHPYFPLLKQAIRRRPGGRVLDCGCGMGEWTLQLADEGVDVVGIDIAERRIELLKQRFGETRFQRGSFLETGFPAESFDVVFNWGGAEHFEAGLQLAFSEAWRVLKPGGYFLASTPAHNLRHMLRGFRQPPPANCATNRRFYQYRFTRAELHAEFAAAGFEVDRILFLDAEEGARRWLSEWFPEGRFRNGLVAAAGRVLPGWLLGHMIFGIGRKPDAAPAATSR